MHLPLPPLTPDDSLTSSRDARREWWEKYQGPPPPYRPPTGPVTPTWELLGRPHLRVNESFDSINGENEMKIVTGKQARPRRILLYGQHGVGKSTWASEAPSPLFLNIEDGLGDIDCSKTEHLKSYGDVVAAISWTITNGQNYRTIVIDTVDWLERLIFSDVARDAGKTTVADIGFGKGYVEAVRKWDFLLATLETARQNGKGIILLGHSRVVRFENPETTAYDRYELDMHKSSNGLIQEWCDEVLFASFRVFTRTEDQGFGKERTLALGGKERYIRTNESAAAVAKNRLRLPDELPMSWVAYAQHLKPVAAPVSQPAVSAPIPPELSELAERFGDPLPTGTDISGLVVNGSSKV